MVGSDGRMRIRLVRPTLKSLGAVSVAVGTVLLLSLGSVAFACTSLLYPELTPRTAAPGATIDVSGSYGVAGAPVALHWNAPDGPVLWSGAVDGSGNFAATFIVPQAGPGRYIVDAVVTPSTSGASPYVGAGGPLVIPAPQSSPGTSSPAAPPAPASGPSAQPSPAPLAVPATIGAPTPAGPAAAGPGPSAATAPPGASPSPSPASPPPAADSASSPPGAAEAAPTLPSAAVPALPPGVGGLAPGHRAVDPAATRASGPHAPALRLGGSGVPLWAIVFAAASGLLFLVGAGALALSADVPGRAHAAIRRKK